jgi:hypothetical protein
MRILRHFGFFDRDSLLAIDSLVGKNAFQDGMHVCGGRILRVSHVTSMDKVGGRLFKSGCHQFGS